MCKKTNYPKIIEKNIVRDITDVEKYYNENLAKSGLNALIFDLENLKLFDNE